MKSTIEKFYKAFQENDAEGMASCYHKDIVFEDPAFGVLIGQKAGNMWRMLCENLKEDSESNVLASNIEANETTGKAHWEAHYTFGKTKRKVHNSIDAKFEFKDGLIINHTDSFDLYKWSKQALGFTGVMIGWTSFFKKKLNAQTNSLLSKFEQNHLEK